MQSMDGIKNVLKNEQNITKIIKEQLKEHKWQGINLTKPPSDNAFTYNAPRLKGGLPRHPNMTHDNSDDEMVEMVPTDITRRRRR